jgi:DNA-binding XRE family transcriptional regulator
MPNLASVLKSEVVRLARRSVRDDLSKLRKQCVSCRADVAQLTRQLSQLQRQLRQTLALRDQPEGPPLPAVSKPAGRPAFSAKHLARQRKRLGLSASDLGLLVGVGGQSIYNWEKGTAPRDSAHLAAIAALPGLRPDDASAIVAQRKAAGR